VSKKKIKKRLVTAISLVNIKIFDFFYLKNSAYEKELICTSAKLSQAKESLIFLNPDTIDNLVEIIATFKASNLDLIVNFILAKYFEIRYQSTTYQHKMLFIMLRIFQEESLPKSYEVKAGSIYSLVGNFLQEHAASIYGSTFDDAAGLLFPVLEHGASKAGLALEAFIIPKKHKSIIEDLLIVNGFTAISSKMINSWLISSAVAALKQLKAKYKKLRTDVLMLDKFYGLNPKRTLSYLDNYKILLENHGITQYDFAKDFFSITQVLELNENENLEKFLAIYAAPAQKLTALHEACSKSGALLESLTAAISQVLAEYNNLFTVNELLYKIIVLLEQFEEQSQDLLANIAQSVEKIEEYKSTIKIIIADKSYTLVVGNNIKNRQTFINQHFADYIALWNLFYNSNKPLLKSVLSIALSQAMQETTPFACFAKHLEDFQGIVDKLQNPDVSGVKKSILIIRTQFIETLKNKVDMRANNNQVQDLVEVKAKPRDLVKAKGLIKAKDFIKVRCFYNSKNISFFLKFSIKTQENIKFKQYLLRSKAKLDWLFQKCFASTALNLIQQIDESLILELLIVNNSKRFKVSLNYQLSSKYNFKPQIICLMGNLQFIDFQHLRQKLSFRFYSKLKNQALNLMEYLKKALNIQIPPLKLRVEISCLILYACAFVKYLQLISLFFQIKSTDNLLGEKNMWQENLHSNGNVWENAIEQREKKAENKLFGPLILEPFANYERQKINLCYALGFSNNYYHRRMRQYVDISKAVCNYNDLQKQPQASWQAKQNAIEQVIQQVDEISVAIHSQISVGASDFVKKILNPLRLQLVKMQVIFNLKNQEDRLDMILGENKTADASLTST